MVQAFCYALPSKSSNAAHIGLIDDQEQEPPRCRDACVLWVRLCKIASYKRKRAQRALDGLFISCKVVSTLFRLRPELRTLCIHTQNCLLLWLILNVLTFPVYCSFKTYKTLHEGSPWLCNASYFRCHTHTRHWFKNSTIIGTGAHRMRHQS